SYHKQEALNFLPSESYSDEQILLMKERVVPYLVEVPKNNKNTVIVAHDDPFEAVTGIYPEPMGICFIIEPKQNGNFDILGSIAIADWK
ncbi:MAG: histidine phosphatase family protein, partial [Verrucomicrobiota bacterium]|nr:histidine phosphatase family protein [Verrucomicrobiota bacterium]